MCTSRRTPSAPPVNPASGERSCPRVAHLAGHRRLPSAAGVSRAETSSRTLERKATGGAAWTIVGLAGGQVVRLGSNLLLTRLLVPEVFGVMALVQVAVLGINLFSDIGIGPSIIQNERQDDRFLDSAWSLGIIRGLFLSLVALLLGGPMAEFYDEPQLRWLIPVAGLAAMVGSLQSTALFTANRNLAIKRLTFIELGSRIAGTIVTIGWALLHPSVWALAVGSVIGPTTKTILSFVALPGGRNRWTWDKEAIGSILSFGKWVFLSTLLTFLASQSDRLIFGRLVSLEALGVYSIALLLASTPPQLFRKLIMRVNFPLYSGVHRSGESMRGVFVRSRKFVLLLAGWASAGLIAGGPTAVRLLYEPEYYAAGWMVQLLGIGVWFNVLSATVESVMLARGESGRIAIANGAKVVGMAILMPIGWVVADFPGAIAGFTASELFRWVGSLLLARRAGLRGLGQAFAYTLMLGATALLGWGSSLAGQALGLHVAVEALLIAVVVSLAWAPLAKGVVAKGLRRLRRR